MISPCPNAKTGPQFISVQSLGLPYSCQALPKSQCGIALFIKSSGKWPLGMLNRPQGCELENLAHCPGLSLRASGGMCFVWISDSPLQTEGLGLHQGRQVSPSPTLGSILFTFFVVVTKYLTRIKLKNEGIYFGR